MNDDDVNDLVAVFNNDDPLHPDLEPYVHETGLGMRVLQHPLVYCVPYTHTSIANHAYLVKTLALQRARDERSWQTYVWLHERPYRLQALCEIEYEFDTDEEFWEMLRDVWMDSENVWQNFDDWVAFFSNLDNRAGMSALMSEEERVLLAALPDRVTVYRGAVDGLNEDGISWTLDQDRAVWFASRFNKGGEVFTRVVDKSEVVAYFTGRGEEEIVVCPRGGW